MATSLAEQLKKLSVPQTSILKDDKKRATLLFDPKHAASLQKETVYDIGLEGIEELILKNESFKQFKNTLFHITSKNFERSVQTKEANKKVNNTINQFFLHLAPYFLTNAAHKALEWLFYRYMVNEYNIKELLLLALPYHNSNIFVKVLQTVKFKNETDPFYFLKTLQKPGLHLPKQNLLNHASSSVTFISIVSKYIGQLIDLQHNFNMLTTQFNFYCTVFVGAIEYSSTIREDLVSQMLPLILKGLSSTIPDFVAATYVITARLMVKNQFSEKLVNKLMQKLSTVECSSLKMEAILVILVIYQSQTQYKELPSMALRNLSKKEWLPSCLQYLNSNGNNIYPFLKVFIRRAAEEGVNNNYLPTRNILTNIVNELKLDDFFVDTFLCTILDVINHNIEHSVEALEWLSEIVKKLEVQYPSNFDNIVGKILSKKDLTIKKRTSLQKVLGHSVTNKENFEIFNSLYHSQQSLRQNALKCLLDKFESLDENEKELLKSFLFTSLHDNSPKVVGKTLKLIMKIDITSNDPVLKQSLIELFTKDTLLLKEWRDVYFRAFSLLCENNKFTWEIFITVFPFIILHFKKYFKNLKPLFKSTFFLDNHLFAKLTENTLKKSKFSMTSFLQCFHSKGDIQEIRDCISLLKCNVETDCLSQFCTIFVLSHMLPNSCIPEIGASIINLLNTFDIAKEKLFSKDTSSIQGYIQMCLTNTCPLEALKSCVEKVILKTVMPEGNIETIDFYKESDLSSYSKALCVFAFSKNRFRNLFDKFLNNLTLNINQKLSFCLNMCISDIINENYICNILGILQNMLKVKDHLDAICIEKYTVSYLLVLLYSNNIEIRKSVLYIIDNLVRTPNEKFSNFLSQILKHNEEIVVDNEQTLLIVQKLLTKTNTHSKNSGINSNVILLDLLEVACNSLTPVYLKSGILTVVSNINTFEVLENLCKRFLDFYQMNKVDNKYDSIILSKLILRIDSSLAQEISLNSFTWKFIKYALKNNQELTFDEQKTSLTVLMLSQLTKDVYEVLSEDLLKELFDIVCQISVVLEDPEVLVLSSKIFKHLDLNAKLITPLLETMKDVNIDKTNDLKTKRRINVSPTVDILDTIEWKKGISVLEFMQGKKKFRNGECLLPLLFDVLKKCLDFEEQAAVEYPKQLILSLILLICSKVEKENVPKSYFNIELVIQCIRASQNPQTHHHALLVLANTADLIPTEVLHHIMAVFTFMGSSLIRHDDAYSFQIIAKIIDSIIPILVSDGNLNTIVNVLRVFVDAILDVPEHRRIPMYKQLLNKIGAKENLYLFLLLSFESQVLHSGREKQKTEKGHLSERLQIALNLCLDFEPKSTLGSCIQLVKYLRQLPDEKEAQTESNIEPISFSNYTPKQFRHYKYLIVTFITSLLCSQSFVNEIARLTDEENLNMEEQYKELIVSILTYIQRTQKISEKSNNTQQAQYWKIMLYHSYDILDSVNALLTPHMFLLVIKGLLMHNIHTVKRRALELLNTKLQQSSNYFDNCNDSELYVLIHPVITIIEIVNNEEMASEHEILVQTALLSLKLLVKALGSEEPEKIIKILEFITDIMNSGKVQNNVLASVILCLVELCVHLRAHAISCLGNFMPAFLKILKNQKNQEGSSLLLLSVVTAVNKLLESLSLFLSPYLKKIIYEVAILISKWGHATKDQKSQALVNKLSGIKQKIGTRMPPRILLPAIEDCYDNLVGKNHFKAIGALMDMLAESLTHLSIKEVGANIQEFTNLFLKTLHFRSSNDVTLEDANLVEEHIVKALTVLVLKLSESTFRPLFLRLYDWAVRSEGDSDRLITYYNLLQTIAQSLKGLFVLFAGHFVNNASHILVKINNTISEESYYKEEIKNMLLLEFVLKTLQAVFTYDSQHFVNKNRFDLLMQPLVDQLENTIGDVNSLVKRNEQLLTPTIVHFLMAVADDALWKQMNYQILLKMRNSSPDIRLVALHCLTEVVTKLGEDFLPLLPETIPFLAELLEDEEERVEKACQKAIHEMEKVLGEPLQKYF